MTIQAKVNLEFKLGSDTYGANLTLPAQAPSGDDPFLFDVARQSGSTDVDTLLSVAVGGSGQIYVAVAPPKNLLSSVGTDVIQQLEVVVQDGIYSAKDKKFTQA